jgi:D-alanine-D-alanine ligase
VTQPKNVWVFHGGTSSEREVSLRSGSGVAEALQRKGYEVSLFDVKPGFELQKLPWAQKPDIVYLALHGEFGEDGTVQGYLESLGIPFVGSGSFASSLCMDKIATKLVLEDAGLPCIPSKHLYQEADLNKFLDDSASSAWIQKKLFIKASRQGSTIGIYRFDPSAESNPRQRFAEICREAFRFDTRLLLEEWIEGRELTVTLFKGAALPVVEIRPKSKFYDFQSKYTKGQTEYLCPAPLEEKVRASIAAAAERAFVVLENRDFCRMDVLLEPNGRFYILEMNTLPGMTETSLVPKAAAASGLNYEDFVSELVNFSYARQRTA